MQVDDALVLAGQGLSTLRGQRTALHTSVGSVLIVGDLAVRLGSRTDRSVRIEDAAGTLLAGTDTVHVQGHVGVRTISQSGLISSSSESLMAGAGRLVVHSENALVATGLASCRADSQDVRFSSINASIGLNSEELYLSTQMQTSISVATDVLLLSDSVTVRSDSVVVAVAHSGSVSIGAFSSVVTQGDAARIVSSAASVDVVVAAHVSGTTRGRLVLNSGQDVIVSSTVGGVVMRVDSSSDAFVHLHSTAKISTQAAQIRSVAGHGDSHWMAAAIVLTSSGDVEISSSEALEIDTSRIGINSPTTALQATRSAGALTRRDDLTIMAPDGMIDATGVSSWVVSLAAHISVASRSTTGMHGASGFRSNVVGKVAIVSAGPVVAAAYGLASVVSQTTLRNHTRTHHCQTLRHRYSDRRMQIHTRASVLSWKARCGPVVRSRGIVIWILMNVQAILVWPVHTAEILLRMMQSQCMHIHALASPNGA